MARVQRLIGISVVAVLLATAFVAGMIVSSGESFSSANATAVRQDAAGGSTAAVKDEPLDRMTKLCGEHMTEMQPAMEEMMDNMMSETMRDMMR